jgi:hypothetical protein
VRCGKEIVGENFGKKGKKCGKKILGETAGEKKTWKKN